MILYGTEVKQLQSVKLNGIFCANCGKDDAMFIFSYVKYGHVFWIPFVPTDKLCVHACGHCSKTLKENEMTPQMKPFSDDLKRKTSFPAWTFIGLIILVASFIYGILNSRQS